jgi:hypothetical protein
LFLKPHIHFQTTYRALIELVNLLHQSTGAI